MTMEGIAQDVSIGDATLHVELRGEGSPVVLHPSLGRWSRDFDHLVAALAAAGFCAITIDPRGVARSVGRLDRVTLRTCADDVVAVLGALDLSSVHLVGHAFGNRVMRQVASSHGDLVRSIILLGAGGKVHGDDEARAAVGRCFELDLAEPERLEAVRVAFFAPGNDPGVWRDGWFPLAKAAQQRALIDARPEQWWLGGTAPMLIVQGLQDRAAPPANGRLLVRERNAPTESVEVDGAGHALLPERPDTVAAHVVSFLRSVSSSEGPRLSE
jgi:pimeloyl-ACP methyl ester carboxylesterase